MSKIFKKKFKYILVFCMVLFLISIIIGNAAKLLFPIKYQQYVYKYSLEYAVDPHLVFAVIKAESNFDKYAISYKDARGLMQISQTTAEWGAQSLDLNEFSIDSLYDPDTNIQIGCWYLNILNKQFGNLDTVLTAYNAGSGNVTRWLKDNRYSNTGSSLDKIPFEETEKFVDRVKRYHIIYRKLYDNGN